MKVGMVLEMFNCQDLGSAGHDGFQNLHEIVGDFAKSDDPDQFAINNSPKNFMIESDLSGNITQVKYIKGGHGSGIQEEVWDLIARFIVSGQFKILNDQEKGLFQVEQNSWIKRLSKVAYLVWLIIFFVLFLIGWVILSLNILEWQQTVLFIIYLWSIF